MKLNQKQTEFVSISSTSTDRSGAFTPTPRTAAPVVPFKFPLVRLLRIEAGGHTRLAT
jgi:hypothetical protein